MWLLLTLLATVCFAIARVVQKSLLNGAKHDPITYAIFFQLSVALFTLPIALANGFAFPPLAQVWPFLLVTILLYCLANIFSYYSLKKIPVSDFTILTATIPIWATITAVLFLHESANPAKLLGVMLTIVGIIIAFYNGKTFVLTKAHCAALLAAVCLGCAFTNDGYLLQRFSATTYSFLFWFLPGLVLGIIYYRKLSGITVFVKDSFISLLIPSFLFAIASFATNVSYQLGGESSQIATITQSSVILTIIFSMIFLGERTNIARKLVAGIIVVIGVILVQII